MAIIDCRFRPLTKEFMHYINPVPALYKITGNAVPAPESLETTLKNFESLGVTRAVVSGRDTESKWGTKVANEYIASLAKEHPLFIGVAGADPLKGHQALVDIEHAIKNLHLKGVSVDPFYLENDCTDSRFYPIYELCSFLQVPVLITIGPLPIGSGYMSWGSPLSVDKVAADFPNLKILASHGGFPYTQEMIAVVWRHENVYIESSIYRHMPGAEMMVQAANETSFGDKMCYASAYPYDNYTTALKKFLNMGYNEKVLAKLLHENAERLFSLK